MSLRVCPVVGCPELTPGGRCSTHEREQDKARGSRQQRGYDATHDRLRAELDPIVQAGRAICMRCGQPIPPGPWDLGHTDDRTSWTGPEHPRCNRSAGGKAAHR